MKLLTFWARITLRKESGPKLSPVVTSILSAFLFPSLLYCLILPFSEASGEAKGAEQTVGCREKREPGEEKGNEQSTEKWWLWGLPRTIVRKKIKKFSCGSELFYVEKDVGMKNADWRGRKAMRTLLSSNRLLSGRGWRTGIRASTAWRLLRAVSE